MSENYPGLYSSTALMSAMGFIQAVTYALCRERNWAQWRLGWNIRLLTVAYVVRNADIYIFHSVPDES